MKTHKKVKQNQNPPGRILAQAVWDVVNMLNGCRTEEDIEGPRGHGFKMYEDDWRTERSNTKMLSKKEKLKLDKAEYDFALALNATRQLGDPLSTIEFGKLYREKFQSFEEYCLKRWGLGWEQVKSLTLRGGNEEVYTLGNLLLPYDHPRTDDFADGLRHHLIEDYSINQENLEMDLYQTRRGKYLSIVSLFPAGFQRGVITNLEMSFNTPVEGKPVKQLELRGELLDASDGYGNRVKVVKYYNVHLQGRGRASFIRDIGIILGKQLTADDLVRFDKSTLIGRHVLFGVNAKKKSDNMLLVTSNLRPLPPAKGVTLRNLPIKTALEASTLASLYTVNPVPAKLG